MTMMTVHQPSILDEIACDDENQRFNACAAVCVSVWATGLNACRTLDERRRWQVKYAQLADRLALTSKYESDPRP